MEEDSLKDQPAVAIAFATAQVRLSHEPCTSIGTPAPDVVALLEDTGLPDTLTRIAVSWPDQSAPPVTVYVHWHPIITVNNLGLLFDDLSSTLFVGAGTVVAAVNLRERRTVDQHTVLLFWGFQRVGQYVLELGEIACFLRAPTGQVLGEASVDPPYEANETSEGVCLTSDSGGTTWLRFPSPVLGG